jgi:hypothetical protein
VIGDTGGRTLMAFSRKERVLKTRVSEVYDHRYRNICELARAMAISVSQAYRVRRGRRRTKERFIIGAMRAFPGYKLDDLFYIGEGE